MSGPAALAAGRVAALSCRCCETLIAATLSRGAILAGLAVAIGAATAPAVSAIAVTRVMRCGENMSVALLSAAARLPAAQEGNLGLFKSLYHVI